MARNNHVDPIVNEVRKIREEIAKRANYDIFNLFDIVKEDVKKIEKEYGIKWKRIIREHGRFVTMEKCKTWLEINLVNKIFNCLKSVLSFCLISKIEFQNNQI